MRGHSVPSRQRSSRPVYRSTNQRLPDCRRRIEWKRWLGSTSTASVTLTASASVTTAGSSPSRSPMRPPTRLSGRNATIVVDTLPTTGQKTRDTPCVHASSVETPSRDTWSMLSANTTASSASMPSAMSSANIVSRFSDTPVTFITSSVPMIASAMPAVTHHATRQLMPSSSATNTRIAPVTALPVSSSRRPSMSRARSLCAWIPTEPGPRRSPAIQPSIRGDPMMRSSSPSSIGSPRRPFT